MRARSAPVAGIDMSLRRIDEAEWVAGLLIEAVVAQGVDTRRLVFGIHRVLGDDSANAHFAFSVSVGDAVEDDAWQWTRRAVESVAATLDSPVDPALVLRARRMGPPALAPTARAAALAQANRSGGRAVVFPGTPELVGLLQVHDILARSAIEEVVDITETMPRTDDLVLVSGPVRPRWNFGRLILYVLPAAGAVDSVYLPFAETLLVND